ncbi:MAG: hypothetical protein JJD92_12700 [Frankiaceae bacterium]|nr:hypothetical protein [Frankiaceae bacterium]
MMRELGARGRVRAELQYRWSDIALPYDEMLRRLAARGAVPAERPEPATSELLRG